MPKCREDHSELVTVDGRDFIVSYDKDDKPFCIKVYKDSDTALYRSDVTTYRSGKRIEACRPGSIPYRVLEAARKKAAERHAAS